MINLDKLKTTASGKRLLQVTHRDLEPFFSSATGDNSIYECPVCNDGSNKLYISNLKNIGHCFKCETIFVFEESYNLEFEATAFVREMKKKVDIIPATYDVLSWTHSILELPDSHVIRSYLTKSRCINYSNFMLDNYGVRWVSLNSEMNLLIFPSDLDQDGYTDFFQYKHLESSMKYISVGIPPIMWLNKVGSTMILAEGVFDAIATRGACLCGKSISEKQKLQLQKYCLSNNELEKIILMLDGDVSCENCLKKGEILKSVSNGRQVYIASLPNGLDPEETVSAGKINEVLSTVKKI